MTEQHEAEMQMLKELLNKKYKKDIDFYSDNDKMPDNRKGVYKMKSNEKKVVCLTHTKTSHIIHIPVKWAKDMDVENDKQIVLEFEFDENKKQMLVYKMK